MDLRGSYVAWAQAVKAAGGTVTDDPNLAGNIPAARYPVSVVFPNAPTTDLGPGFTRLPDTFAASGQFVYYDAPSDAQAYADTQMLTAGVVPGEATGNPAWYDFLKDFGKQVAIGVAVAVALAYVLRSRKSR